MMKGKGEVSKTVSLRLPKTKSSTLKVENFKYYYILPEKDKR